MFGRWRMQKAIRQELWESRQEALREAEAARERELEDVIQMLREVRYGTGGVELREEGLRIAQERLRALMR